jgi:hypothetical protein
MTLLADLQAVMCMTAARAALFICILAVPGGIPATPKERGACPDAAEYEYDNQVDPPPLTVGKVEGRTVIDAQMTGWIKRVEDKVPGACFSLFTEAEHRLVSSTTADERGMFQFEKIPEGNYRLVGRVPGFCPANQAVHLRRWHSVRVHPRKLVVHFTVHAIDTCSYIDFGGGHWSY